MNGTGARLEGMIALVSRVTNLPVVIGFDGAAVRRYEPAWWARIGTEPEQRADDAASAISAAYEAHTAEARAIARRQAVRLVFSRSTG